ncbi:HD domain-containing protein [Saccharothrix yanglingensis]|uniref:Phosphohydrolase n=1 Tax=Saccharothrix yanglingensis TaxID=659496 RepID=A0ABU0WZD1_9PSEU|nr:HD domain-containing protein [Saccharothrix yanglingensis]MDQ2585226.1 phosphohydrolase [Saccharothrix yanglingensis]
MDDTSAEDGVEIRSDTGGHIGRRALLESGARLAVGAGVLGTAAATQGGTAAAAAPSARRPATGLRLPDTALARQAMRFARDESSEVLFNHVMRSYHFGVLLLERAGARYDRELLFIGSVLHDLGLVERFTTPTERFELDGADAARRFLRERGMAADRVDVVWDAIALHTNATIAARKRPEIAAVAAGAGVDVGGRGLEALDPDDVAAVVAAHPRTGFKRDTVDTMVDQCRRKPMAYFTHPFAEVGRRHIPGFAVPTVEDVVLAAPFPD